MLRGEHDKSDRLSSYALDIGAPSRAVYLISIILTCLPSHTSGSARCTLLSQADDELRWSGESTQRASMINGQCNALGGRRSLQKRTNAAQASLSGSQAKRYSLGAHLLSIRLEQTGLHPTPRRAPIWNSRKAVLFLSCRSRTTSDRKQLFVVRCAIANSIELRRALARWTERAVGNRGKLVIWLKSSQKTRSRPPRAWTRLKRLL